MMTASPSLPGEPVVHAEPQSKLPPGEPRTAVHRPRELQRFHKARGNSHQNFALADRFADECYVAVLEIADSAVNESRRSARGTACPLLHFHERNSHSPHRCIARDPRSSDASTDPVSYTHLTLPTSDLV